MNDIIELEDRLIDLLRPGILFGTRRGDLLYQLGGLSDVRNDRLQHSPRLLGHRHAGGGELADLSGGLLTPLGEFSHLACDYREPLTVVSRPGGLDCGVEGQQIGIPGDLLDDGDLFGDLLHRRHGLMNRVAALFRVPGYLPGDLFGL